MTQQFISQQQAMDVREHSAEHSLCFPTGLAVAAKTSWQVMTDRTQCAFKDTAQACISLAERADLECVQKGRPVCHLPSQELSYLLQARLGLADHPPEQCPLSPHPSSTHFLS